jgi:hypothetical protein
MNCGTLSRLRQAAGLLALSKFATLAPQQYNLRADSYLARYAARNANFVHVVRPHNGLGARSAPKDAGLTSREALPGISRGGAPWLVSRRGLMTVTPEAAGTSPIDPANTLASLDSRRARRRRFWLATL